MEFDFEQGKARQKGVNGKKEKGFVKKKSPPRAVFFHHKPRTEVACTLDLPWAAGISCAIYSRLFDIIACIQKS